MNADSSILDLSPAEARFRLESWVRDRGLPTYRARQILPRLWTKPALDWASATDLPASLREALQADLPLARLELEVQQDSAGNPQVSLAAPR